MDSAGFNRALIGHPATDDGRTLTPPVLIAERDRLADVERPPDREETRSRRLATTTVGVGGARLWRSGAAPVRCASMRGPRPWSSRRAGPRSLAHTRRLPLGDFPPILVIALPLAGHDIGGERGHHLVMGPVGRDQPLVRHDRGRLDLRLGHRPGHRLDEERRKCCSSYHCNTSSSMVGMIKLRRFIDVVPG